MEIHYYLSKERTAAGYLKGDRSTGHFPACTSTPGTAISYLGITERSQRKDGHCLDFSMKFKWYPLECNVRSEVGQGNVFPMYYLSLMMVLFLREILLEEAEVRVGTGDGLFARRGCRFCDLGRGGFSSVVCGELPRQVSWKRRCFGCWRKSILLHVSNMGVFGL